jgi:hypothetical protein
MQRHRPTPAQILETIRDRFASGEWRWARPFECVRDNEAMCLLSGVYAELGERGQIAHPFLPYESEWAINFLALVICDITDPGEPYGEESIIVQEWNDEADRTLKDVLALLAAAKAMAEAHHAI